jgi:hypothetical protein
MNSFKNSCRGGNSPPQVPPWLCTLQIALAHLDAGRIEAMHCERETTQIYLVLYPMGCDQGS